MKRSEAIEWVQSHEDDSPMDQGELREVFTVLLNRVPDEDEDVFEQWSLCCSEVF